MKFKNSTGVTVNWIMKFKKEKEKKKENISRFTKFPQPDSQLRGEQSWCNAPSTTCAHHQIANGKQWNLTFAINMCMPVYVSVYQK